MSLLADLLALEELDVVLGVKLDDGLLPGARLARGVAAPLRLWLHAHRPDVADAHAEDLLDRLSDLRLVGPLVHAERVLVRVEERVALLRHDRPDDHTAGVHAAASLGSAERRAGARAIAARRSSAGSETMSREAPTMSATP